MEKAKVSRKQQHIRHRPSCCPTTMISFDSPTQAAGIPSRRAGLSKLPAHVHVPLFCRGSTILSACCAQSTAEQLKDKAKEVAERVKPDFVPEVNKVRSLQFVETLLRAHVATHAWVQFLATHGHSYNTRPTLLAVPRHCEPSAGSGRCLLHCLKPAVMQGQRRIFTALHASRQRS